MTVLLWGCLDEPNVKPQKKQSILDNLPVNDRDLLLAPLEHSLDDLRKSIDMDESLFHSDLHWRLNHMVGTMEYKLDGPDTVMARVGVIGKTPMEEHHSWYYDNDGRLFYSEHHMLNMDFGYETAPITRDYKFYFEENGSLLSSYGKVGFGRSDGEGQWTPVCLTESEESFVIGRIAKFRQMAMANHE